MAGAQQQLTTEVDGQTMKLTNLGKVLYPQTGFTKAEVIDYYHQVAELLLPHLSDRPLTRKRWPDGTEAAFTVARRAGVPTVLDAEVADADVFERLLPLTDHAIFSQPALAGFAGPDIDAALKRIEKTYDCGVSAVTLGERGVEWRVGNEPHRLPAFAVTVIDTNGAGDVFHGAYAFALGTGMKIGKAIGFASAAAALKCARPAGRGGIPTFDDITAFQRTTA